jgi:hypothetical protein
VKISPLAILNRTNHTVGQNNMSGLFGTELELRKRHIRSRFNHNSTLESREAIIAFGTPYEILLGALCASVHDASRIGQFFVTLSLDYPREVEQYLLHFVERMKSELNWQDCSLEIKIEYQNSPMDFPRPSPTRNFVIPAFIREIRKSENLARVVSAFPIRIE